MHLECYDSDIISSDDLLGTLELNLSNIIRGSELAKSCKLTMLKNKNIQRFDLFSIRNHRGWWPFNTKDKKPKLAV